MRKLDLIVISITIILITGCSGQQTATVAAPIIQQDSNEAVLAPAKTAAPDCLGDGINLIGESIADEYETASYKQVMTWFCNGAEFEDILVALETESQTGILAEEMLVMISNGISWEEIWQFIGFTD